MVSARKLDVERCATQEILKLTNSGDKRLSPEVLERVLQIYENADVEPAARLYRAVLQACLKADEVRRAIRLFHDIPRAARDQIQYSSVLKACARGIVLDEGADANFYYASAQRVFSELVSDSNRIGNPDVVVCAGMLEVLVKMGGRSQFLQGLQFLEDMPRKFGVQANLHCCSIALNACNDRDLLFRLLDLTRSCIRDLEELEGRDNDEVWKKTGRFSRAEFRSLRVVHTAMVNACTRLGEYDLALRKFDDLGSMDIRPDSTAYVAVISALAAGLVDRSHSAALSATDAHAASILRAEELFAASLSQKSDVPESEKKNKAMLYCAMIAFYQRCSRCSEVLRLHEEMQAGGIEPDAVTVSAIVSACQKDPAFYTLGIGIFERFHKRMQHLQKRHSKTWYKNVKKGDFHVYSAAIRLCERANWPMKGLQIFEDLVVPPNVHLRKDLASCLEKAIRVEAGRATQAVSQHTAEHYEGRRQGESTEAMCLYRSKLDNLLEQVSEDLQSHWLSQDSVREVGAEDIAALQLLARFGKLSAGLAEDKMVAREMRLEERILLWDALCLSRKRNGEQFHSFGIDKNLAEAVRADLHSAKFVNKFANSDACPVSLPSLSRLQGCLDFAGGMVPSETSDFLCEYVMAHFTASFIRALENVEITSEFDTLVRTHGLKTLHSQQSVSQVLSALGIRIGDDCDEEWAKFKRKSLAEIGAAESTAIGMPLIATDICAHVECEVEESGDNGAKFFSRHSETFQTGQKKDRCSSSSEAKVDLKFPRTSITAWDECCKEHAEVLAGKWILSFPHVAGTHYPSRMRRIRLWVTHYPCVSCLGVLAQLRKRLGEDTIFETGFADAHFS